MNAMRRTTTVPLAAALAWLIISQPGLDVLAADWPQWLGPDHSGVTPARLWSTNVGKGCTSPILAAGRLYAMGWTGRGGGNPVGTDSLLCLDARTGAEVWRRTYPCRYQSRIRTGDTEGYGGPSSTPTFDGETGYLYTLSIDGHLCCWDTRRQGAPVWAMNFHDAYQIPQRPDVGQGKRDYGHPGSPLVVNSQVIVEVGDDSGTVMAFDKKTGRRMWASQATELGGHSGGPTPFVVDGVPCLATLALRKVIVMRIDRGHEGRTVGEFPWTTDFANNIATPAAWKNQLVISSDYNVSRMALLEVSLERGIRETWRVRDHSKVCSPVIYKGRIFTVDGTLKCLDLATGRRIWSGGQFGHGSVLVTAGDDRVIAFGREPVPGHVLPPRHAGGRDPGRQGYGRQPDVLRHEEAAGGALAGEARKPAASWRGKVPSKPPAGRPNWVA
ncbi:MAG: hypothetical protein AMK72_12415 [Planctomycetes bacterium SM23_25]|nr:MAG: hypothetical protein AMK72_12415 [Planctomycetes bacterium SM23_25]